MWFECKHRGPPRNKSNCFIDLHYNFVFFKIKAPSEHGI